MSTILDALKKSEAERAARAGQGGPEFLEPVAAKRNTVALSIAVGVAVFATVIASYLALTWQVPVADIGPERFPAETTAVARSADAGLSLRLEDHLRLSPASEANLQAAFYDLPNATGLDVPPELAALSQVEINAHAYSPEAARRFLMVNLKRVEEGGEIVPGVEVRAILPDAVALRVGQGEYLWRPDR